jgi:hypothetical protein
MKPKHGEIKVRGRPGGKEDTFPVDVNEVENEALREALRRMRDGVYPVEKLRAGFELRYGGTIGPSGGVHIGLCLPAAICEKHLTHLQLPNQRIGMEGARAIARGLRHNKGVIYVDLRANSVLDAGAAAFAKMLKTNDTLRTLCLDANRITDAGAEKLAEALDVRTSRNYALGKLSVKHNDFCAATAGVKGGGSVRHGPGMKALGEAIAHRVGRPLLIYPRPPAPAVDPTLKKNKHHRR